MHKVLYIPTLNLGVIYWRIENYANELVKHKEECAVHVEYFLNPEFQVSWESLIEQPSEEGRNIRAKLKAGFKYYDSIIFQKIQDRKCLEYIKRMMKEFPKVDVLLELDDSIGDVSGSNPFEFKDQHSIAAEQAKISDAIICSTEYLKESIIPIVGENKPIHVAPNCVNYDIWTQEGKENTTDKIRIGYVGGFSHDEDLLIAYRAIEEILDKRDDIEFVIRYGGFKPDYIKDHPQIDFKQVNWHISKYSKKLEDMCLDIAIAPLRDTNFNRCKSNIKWLEWASLGVPLIASNVITYKDKRLSMLRASNSKSSWVERIEEMVNEKPYENWDLRKEAKEFYNIENECNKLLGFLKNF